MEYINNGHIGVFIMQVAGNILVTLPLPFVVWFCSRGRKMKKVCAVSLIVTAAIEPVQLLINLFLGGPSNIIDVDDLILNLTGCAAGLLLLKAEKFRADRTQWRSGI
jgi:glycopeptide antibiotics resistance protein